MTTLTVGEQKQKAQDYVNQAVTLHRQGKLEEAKTLYKHGLTLNPSHPYALNMLGVIARHQKHYNEAERYMQKALDLLPKEFAFYQNYGNLLLDKKEPEKALLVFEKANSLRPHYNDVLNGIATALYSLGRYEEAIEYLQQVIIQNDKHAMAWYNLGNIYREQGLPLQAIPAYQRAIAIQPDYYTAKNNLGIAFKDIGHWEKSITILESLLPTLTETEKIVEVHYNIAMAYMISHQYDKAIPRLKTCLSLDPHHFRALGNLVRAMQNGCIWDEKEYYEQQLLKVTDEELQKDIVPPVTPFNSLSFYLPLSKQLEIARNYTKHKVLPLVKHRKTLGFSFDLKPKEKLKIGYLSADFRDHPVGHLIAGLFQHHNREEFEIYAYAINREDGSECYRQVRDGVDHLIDIEQYSFTEAAKKIYMDGIDILVDLMGYTLHSRPGILALCPAPIQVQSLGMLGSMGADFIDYIVTDETCFLPEDEQFYDEKPLYLPSTFLPAGNNPVTKIKVNRAMYGLPEDKFVFCSFNSNHKIDPELYDAWMKILKKAKNSVLWLYCEREMVQERLRQEAEKRGVDSSRIIFAGTQNRAGHLARLQLADLFLDSFNHNAGATAIDSVRSGLPLLTRYGHNIVTRMASSVVKSAQTPELVTENTTQYIQKAVYFSQNPEALAVVRKKLKKAIKSPAFDNKHYVVNMEQQFKQIWEYKIYNSRYKKA